MFAAAHSVPTTAPPPPRKAARRWRVCVICDDAKASSDIGPFLGNQFETHEVEHADLPTHPMGGYDAFVVDAWFGMIDDLQRVGHLLAALSHRGKPVFLAAREAQQLALGADARLTNVSIVSRPFSPEWRGAMLTAMLQPRHDPEERRAATRSAFVSVPRHAEALVAADEALERIFAIGAGDGPLELRTIDRKAEAMIESLGASDVGGWISGVRLHHDSTYQHCLLVTGIAVAFGHQLGFARSDLRRLAIGAMLHDIGKARVPVAILDKPAALDDEEQAIIRRHPEIGEEMLRESPDITTELLSVVRHHHEYLDGSGYPDGLCGAQIPDLVRLMTIADVFGALIEKRAYRAPMSGAEAYDVLLSMRGKLDMPIVRAVRRTAFAAEG